MKPSLSTLRDRIRAVPGRFRCQYEKSSYWDRPFGRPHGHQLAPREIAQALDALDTETCTEADVDAVMGVTKPGSGWCASRCDGCEANTSGTLVFVGDAPDYESSSASLCVPCLREALALVELAS